MNYITQLERAEKRQQEMEKKYILKNVPHNCAKCPHLQILSVKKVYCPYMIGKCILK